MALDDAVEEIRKVYSTIVNKLGKKQSELYRELAG